MVVAEKPEAVKRYRRKSSSFHLGKAARRRFMTPPVRSSRDCSRFFCAFVSLRRPSTMAFTSLRMRGWRLEVPSKT